MSCPRVLCWSTYCFTVLFAMGCEPLTVNLPTTPTPTPSPIVAPFDTATTGTITGRVEWQGEVPNVPQPNAYRPIINNGGLASAIVYLRDVTTAKPWDHPPVKVVLDEKALTVEQGETRSSVGFVRVGEAGAFASKTKKIGGISARGDAFFTQMFPPLADAISRTFPQPGVVTLSSASRQDWANATLFVCEHPYYVRTDSDGRFTLTQVPAGSYELFVWHGDWGIMLIDRDPESGGVSRRHYGPPVQDLAFISVVAGQPTHKAIPFAGEKLRTSPRRIFGRI